MEDVRNKPAFTIEDAKAIALERFGISGEVSTLPGERDQNFKVTSSDGSFVLKIAHPAVQESWVEFENAAIQIAGAIRSIEAPLLIKSKASTTIETVRDRNRQNCLVRMISFLDGVPLAMLPEHPNQLLQKIGESLGLLDRELAHLNTCPAATRDFKWDLKSAPAIVEQSLGGIADEESHKLLTHFLEVYREVADRLPSLRESVIHNDANDYNLLIGQDVLSDEPMVGVIDFGDMLYSHLINDVAICGAYLLLDKENPIDAIVPFVKGFHSVLPLDEDELSVVFPLMCMRLCQSVCIAAEQQRQQPDNEYLGVTEKPAWETLARLFSINPAEVHLRLSDECAISSKNGNRNDSELTAEDQVSPADLILKLRKKHLSPSLSLSYDKPLHIIRGRGQYLYDVSDITYLDCVNNVCHVGHCHPDVVQAATAQMGQLNTNTRYLHDNIVRYANRLVSTLPDPLEVCFFVNSGSEANDLALRLARIATGNHDVVIVDGAYHGHLSSLIDISPYKFNQPGGNGKPEHVHVVPAPDCFRVAIRCADGDCGKGYGELATEVIEGAVNGGRSIAAFFAESILSCGGQIPLPDGYLSAVYESIRNAGGVCIADEVQVGFGRVGSDFWAFEHQGVVPDIVTMGKPIGNGHPLAALVTTREIADAFNNGMEYFNTYGGNPVSCAVGMAVLDVIEKEELQANALNVGQWLLENLAELMTEFEAIGDVRGRGLFIGVEFVKDRASLTPDAELAHRVVQEMRSRRILLSTDGPLNNVIKIKPPIVFGLGDAERLVMTLRQTLAKLLANE